jgi:hypothetical protein
MWGSRGSIRRRQIIRAEFWIGAVGCTALGAFLLSSGGGWGLVLGVWLIGAGINYLPLALHAQSLLRPGALETELDSVDLRRELRQAGVRQLWIAVPFAVAIAALAQARPQTGGR